MVGRGGPRDLAAIRDGISAAGALAARLDKLSTKPAEIADAIAALRQVEPALAKELAAALADELPLLKRDGGFVRAGYDGALDESRALRDESRKVIAQLQARYADDTGVKSLKIRHNNVLGYFVDVTAQHGDKLMAAPLNATFIHRQTTAGQVRFTTTELGELEAKIASAADRALGLELEIFDRLGAAVIAASDTIKAAAEALALLDVASALATLAVERCYVRPEIDRSLDFVIEGGRHAVVEQALSDPFVANDCDLSPPKDATAGRIWLLTGPNMAGKSTFLRQNALIVVLAQMGSFVPAKRAKIGVVDRLFSRVGAADDLARGRSTFMVEMVETAAILNQAGERSLVILDEIGRGTATFDGLSIAWAAIEHLHESNRCRALFATHFHELTALSAKLPRLHNATVRVKEWQGEVVFLHEVIPGAADHSYGIQVAKLAGLPASVIERAKVVLAMLEADDRSRPRGFEDLPLFATPLRPSAPDPRQSALDALIAALSAMHPDELSPREALEALYALKQKASGQAIAGCGRLAPPPAVTTGARQQKAMRKPMNRWPGRLILSGLLLASAALTGASARAEPFPDHTVTIVVTSSAGALTDVLTRAIALQLSQKWGQPVVVENRGGAGHTIGATAVMKAEPDGHTLLASETGFNTIQPFIHSPGKLPYDPNKDFVPVAGYATIPMAALVNPSRPAKSIPELIALAKQKPPELRHRRRRHRAAHRRDAAGEPRRHQAHGGSLSRRGSCAQRPARGAHRPRHHGPVRRIAVGARRQAQHAGLRQPDARG